MLDRDKIAKEIASFSQTLFSTAAQYTWFTAQIWQALVTDERFVAAIEQKRATLPLCTWINDPAVLHTAGSIQAYGVCAVDGSQIYPDHHMIGIECFLINSGACFISYGQQSTATLFSEPYIYTPEHCIKQLLPMRFSAELVDLLREEHEFALLTSHVDDMITLSGLPQPFEARESVVGPFVALFDGNMLFWHLESKPTQVKEVFMSRYLVHLHALAQKRISVAGYLSATRFTEVVELIRAGIDSAQAIYDLITPAQVEQLASMLASLSDADLFMHILQPGQYTTLFASNHPITEWYPKHLKPYFFYLHAGSEVVRIEVPAWMAHDPERIKVLVAVCMDQCAKGQGYPVVLAEAHAQAVVQSADREFFYHLLCSLAIRHNKRVALSQKSLKKKILGL